MELHPKDLYCSDQLEMMYCTSTVSLSMKTSSGTRLMVDLSSSLISMSTVHSWDSESNVFAANYIDTTFVTCVSNG